MSERAKDQFALVDHFYSEVFLVMIYYFYLVYPHEGIKLKRKKRKGGVEEVLDWYALPAGMNDAV